MQNTAEEARMKWVQVRLFYGPLHMDTSVSADQQEITYNSSVRTQDVIWKTCQERWFIGTDEEKELVKSMVAAQLDDDENANSFVQDLNSDRWVYFSQQWHYRKEMLQFPGSG